LHVCIFIASQFALKFVSQTANVCHFRVISLINRCAYKNSFRSG